MRLKTRGVPLRKRESLITPIRLAILALAVVAGGLIWYKSEVDAGQILAPFAPTSTPTRSARSYIEEAQAWFAAGKFQDSVIAYDLALQVTPDSVDLWVGKARAQMFAEDEVGALESANRAVLIDVKNVKAHAIKAWALWRADQLYEAGQEASQAIALDQNYAPAHAYYSLVLNSQQRYEQGFEEAKLAVSLDPQLIEAHYALGKSNEAQGLYDQAIPHYERGLLLNPQVIFLYRQIGLNYRTLGVRAAINDNKEAASQYFGEAIAALNRAVAIDAKNVTPYLDLARTYLQIDQLGTAQQYLDDALALQPENPVIHGRLALLYMQRKNYEGALTSMELAIEGGVYTETLESGDVVAYSVTGLPLEDPVTLEFYYTYGNLLAYFQRCDEARTYLVRALEFDPENPTVQGSFETSSDICRLGGTPTPTPDATDRPAAPLATAEPTQAP